MAIDYLDPINIIVREEMELLSKKWEKSSKSWHRLFVRSLKRFWIFPLADEKWTYWTFMQPNTVWPTSGMTVKDHLMLKFAKIISHLNPKQVYIDRGFGIDPERPDKAFSHDDVALGLRLWAQSFEKYIFKRMIRDFEYGMTEGAKRIMEKCPEYFGEPCTFEEARRIFYKRAIKLARANALPMRGFTNQAVILLQDLYRV